jgi:hypothetical protein
MSTNEVHTPTSVPTPRALTHEYEFSATATTEFSELSATATTELSPPDVIYDPVHAGMNQHLNYVDQEVFFTAVQDIGTAVPGCHVGKKAKQKQGHFLWSNTHYQGIYNISNLMYLLYQSRPEVFAKLPQNKTIQVRRIATWIIESRQRKARADIHSVTSPSILPSIQRSDPGKTHFYILEQAEVLRKGLTCWCGETLEEKQRPTDNDRLRIMGILFSEDFREDIPVLLQKSFDRRLELDSAKQKKNEIFQRVMNAFADEEFVVTHPTKWELDSTKDRIGHDIWTMYDPNDMERIQVPRLRKHMEVMFGTTLIAYNAIMEIYTKGTGGGDGHDASYVNWREREDYTFADYDSRSMSQYLSWVFMYDKQHGFLLVVSKGPLPTDASIEDGSRMTTSSGRSTPVNVIAQELRVARIDNDRQRAALMESMTCLLADSSKDSNSSPHARTQRDVLDDISTTKSSLKELAIEQREAKKKKRALDNLNLVVDISDTRRLKKLKRLKKATQRLDRQVDTLQETLDGFFNELNAMNKSHHCNTGEHSSENSSSDSDSDSDDS